MGNGIKILDTKNASAMPTVIKSLTVIGLVCTANIATLNAEIKANLTANQNVLRFNDADEALKVFENVKGTAREDLYDIKMQNVKSPIIVSLVEIETSHYDSTPQEFYGDENIKVAVMGAVENLQLARSLYGKASKVRIAIAPYFSHDTDVAEKLEVLSVGTKIVAIRDLNLASVNDALPVLETLGSKRALVFPFYRLAYSIYEKATVAKPNSAIVAGHIAYWDAKLGEFGFAFDHANRPIYDVSGVSVPLAYEEGEETCSTNVIVNAGGAVLLNDDGWKLYNFETPSDDARFNKLETMRFFDGMNENIQLTLKRHKHRPAKEVFYFAKADTDVFIGKAVKSGSAIGGKVWWDDRNTPNEVANGMIYMSYDAGNNVGIRSIVIQPYATDDYYADLIADNQIEEIKG